MSKGNPVRTMRIPPDLYRQIEEAIKGANESRREEPYDFTSWVLACVKEKLAKLKRGRAPRKRGAGRAAGPEKVS